MTDLISIHALREEGDVSVNGFTHILVLFLSTPSARRATVWPSKSALPRVISIHALREEGDNQCVVIIIIRMRISIHALREEGDVPLRVKRR